MANQFEVLQSIHRRSLMTLHQKLNFIGTVNRDYDDSFAKTGAKIGDQLRIRKANEYAIGDGRVITPQSTNEESITLTVATQKHVAMDFTSADLKMSMDDIQERNIEPAMSRLASKVESICLQTAYKDLYNAVGTPGTNPNALLTYLQAKTKLNKGLAPKDNNRCVIVNSEGMDASVDALKALFQDQASIAKQYKEGYMGRAAGLNFYENELIPTHTTGSRDNTTPLVNGASQEGTSLVCDGFDATSTIKKGDVFTIDDVYAVHPETKDTYQHLQQFVVTADATAVAGEVTLSISPAIITDGAKQTVSAGPANDAALSFAGSASTNYSVNMAYHKDAFTFVSADQEIFQGAHYCRQERFDGIVMRMWQDGDIINDRLITRIDVVFGFLTQRPEIATKIWGGSPA